ncbi:hypothetical protein CH063_09138 [Colletotrichum higginsianum]|uniref:Uncharacterized protein n=1 Tax=Colletotrichum higginsianum (strain IMI 349063) TaxID=759273 RepID=H1VCG6_COLHI|nr:hypothetical protein CH063_09138 [Colletotrichum higginsianum]
MNPTQRHRDGGLTFPLTMKFVPVTPLTANHRLVFQHPSMPAPFSLSLSFSLGVCEPAHKLADESYTCDRILHHHRPEGEKRSITSCRLLLHSRQVIVVIAHQDPAGYFLEVVGHNAPLPHSGHPLRTFSASCYQTACVERSWPLIVTRFGSLSIRRSANCSENQQWTNLHYPPARSGHEKPTLFSSLCQFQSFLFLS